MLRAIKDCKWKVVIHKTMSGRYFAKLTTEDNCGITPSGFFNESFEVHNFKTRAYCKQRMLQFAKLNEIKHFDIKELE